MKFWKSIFLSACSFLAIATTVTYTSCEKDACTQLTCKNGGACAEGFCRCKAGFEGTECELKIANRFIGRYVGVNHCNTDPALIDTVDVYIKVEPNIVEFGRRAAPGTKFQGQTLNNDIIVNDEISGGFRRHVTGIIDGKELTVHVEEYTNGTKKSVCNFVGYRNK